MSSQSFGRSNIALQTVRCSGARIGIVVPANGTRRSSPRHLRVERVVGEEEVDGVAVPPESDLAVALECLLVDLDIDTERAQRIADLLPALGGDEDVDIHVDGRARLRVVGERERAADRVGILAAVSARSIATTFSGRESAPSGRRLRRIIRSSRCREADLGAAAADGIASASSRTSQRFTALGREVRAILRRISIAV